jgi:hypothetical protein
MYLKFKRLAFLSAIVLFCFPGCDKDPFFNGLKKAGHKTSEERVLPSFRAITINDMFDVSLTKDTINKVILEGGENLLPSIVTKSENGLLTIKDDNTCSWARSYDNRISIKICYTSLDSIMILGQANLKSLDTICAPTIYMLSKSPIADIDVSVNCGVLHSWVYSGTGTYKLSGKANYANLYVNGMAYMYAQNLVTETTSVQSLTIGDIIVNASKSVNVNIFRSGNVYYTGNPSISIDRKSSTGNVIKLTK